MSVEMGQDYRHLSEAEVRTLRERGCTATNWADVMVRGQFAAERMTGVSFVGAVRLGDMGGTVHVTTPGLDMGRMESAIVRATLKDVTLGDWFYIQDVNLLADYTIGGRFVAIGCGRIVGGDGPFGIGARVSVVNEGGGREVSLSASLTSNIAYCVAMHRYVSGLVEGYERLTRQEAADARAEIGKDVHIFSTRAVEGVRIGTRAVVDGASALRRGTIVSAPEQPTLVGADVTAEDFVFAEGATVDGGSKLKNCFVGQCVTVGRGFVGENLLAFANSELLCGEAVSVLAGPYTVSHHKGSLLIAAAYSFYNAGSSTNGSNHHYRLGPIEQAVYDRGAKTGSGAYVLEPAHIGAFTMVVGHHRTNPDTRAFPFSVLAERDGESHLIVAQNLRTMGLFRDGLKWKSRDRRKIKSDAISYDILNPITASLMMEAVRRIEGGLMESRSEHLIEGGLRIRRALLPRAAAAYRSAIDIYVAKAYAHDGGKSESLDCEWADAGGLVAPLPKIRDIERKIADGAYANVAQIGADFRDLAEKAKGMAIRWCVGRAREWYGYTDTEDDVKDAIQHVAEACHNLKEATLADATREWGAKMKTSYGLDGTDEEQDRDFAALRGDFEQNADVRECRKYYDETW